MADYRNENVDSAEKLVTVARTGNHLVSEITQYLSTIPTPVDVLEDLASIVAVTSSLILSLHGDILQFSPCAASQPRFIHPLCVDISSVFEVLRTRFEGAKEKRVFEPDGKGLVRTPRFVWFEVMGGQGKAAGLRSRLCVEKYRVRVLIDAVRFKGLRGLQRGSCLPCLGPEEVEELEQLETMLPIIVERLIGVQKDYVPRLQASVSHRKCEVAATLEKKGRETVVSDMKNDVEDLKFASITRKSTNMSSSSSNSVASSMTVFDDSIEEAWLLRKNESKEDLNKTRYLFGMKIWSTYHHAEPSYYVKPLPASTVEIQEMRKSALGKLSQSQHEAEFKKKILAMDDKAQWDIQRLLEARESASSSECLKRNWEIVSLLVRPRRKINNVPAQKRWWKKEKKAVVEWVLIIRGETVDHQKRSTPVKHEDPWKLKREKEGQVKSKGMARASVGDVLTHVEKRKFMSMEEAERRMGVMLVDLFGSEI